MLYHYSATEGRDFQSGPVTITLPASATTSCTELSVIIDDTIYENSQRFDLGMNVVSSQPYISLGSIDRAVVTILDNDGKNIIPQFKKPSFFFL